MSSTPLLPHASASYRSLFLAAAVTALGSVSVLADEPGPTIDIGFSREDVGFKFDSVPPPAVDDAAAGAIFKVLGGAADPNAGNGVAVLNDGKIPASQDDPAGNFFFARGAGPDRLLIDLGKVIDVKTVATYSWHGGGRAAQNYTIYAADGLTSPAGPPAADADLEKAGWKLLAKVDTAGKPPGQHAVEISGAKDATLGKSRYLLLETRPNEDASGFGQTFWSEIDVIDATAPEVKRLTPPEKIIDVFTTDDGKYKFTVDSTKSPDLREWFEAKVMPEVKVWYPKIVDLLAVPGFPSPTEFSLRLEEGVIMPGNRGVPAFASGRSIVVSSEFIRSEQKGEAVGCVIHEITHIAQNSDWGRGNRRRVPGWVVEGVADYVRWFLFEPETNGAAIRNPDRAKHDASYRVTANFFNWVAKNHVQDLARKLNATFSTGYNDGLWKEWTGKTVEELEADWKKSLETAR